MDLPQVRHDAIKKRSADVDDDAVSKRRRLDSPTEEDDGRSTTGAHSSPSPEHDAESGATPPTPASQPKHWRPSIYKCTHDGCGKSFNRPCRLAEHMRSHTGERPFACPFDGCDKTFVRENHLARHVKSAHTDERAFACAWPGCGKRFVNGSRLRRHERAHEQREQFRCSLYPPCAEVFRKHATLQAHVATVHLGKKPYACAHVDDDTGEACGGEFGEEAKLRAHVAKAHGAERRYACAICTATSNDDGEEHSMADVAGEDAPVSFSSYSALQDHIRTAHPPTCDFCRATFTTHRELARHVELLHSPAGAAAAAPKAALFRCDEAGCDKAFSKRGNLNEHVRIVHRGERRFVCGATDVTGSSKFVDERGAAREWDASGACGRAFTTKASLEEHVRTQHLGLEGTIKVKKRARLVAAGRDPEAVEAMGGRRTAAKARGNKGVARRPAVARLTGLDDGAFVGFSEDRFWLGGYNNDDDDDDDDDYDGEVNAGMFGGPFGSAAAAYDWAAEAAESAALDGMAGVGVLPAVDVHAREHMPVDPALDAVSAFLREDV